MCGVEYVGERAVQQWRKNLVLAIPSLKMCPEAADLQQPRTTIRRPSWKRFHRKQSVRLLGVSKMRGAYRIPTLQTNTILINGKHE